MQGDRQRERGRERERERGGGGGREREKERERGERERIFRLIGVILLLFAIASGLNLVNCPSPFVYKLFHTHIIF